MLFVQADPEDRWSRLAIADNYRRMGLIDDAETTMAPLPDSDRDAMAIRVMLAMDRHQDDRPRRCSSPFPPTTPRWPGCEAAWLWPGTTCQPPSGRFVPRLPRRRRIVMRSSGWQRADHAGR